MKPLEPFRRRLIHVMGRVLVPVRSGAGTARASTARRIIVLTLAAWTVVPVAAATGQDTLVVRGSCEDCELRLEPVAILGGADLPFELGSRSGVSVMSDGRLVVAPTMNPGEIAVFSPSGDLQRVFGREGQGPGEYQRITTADVGPGDTIHVFEYGVVSRVGPDFSFLERIPLQFPPPDRWTILPSGELVVLAVRLGEPSPPMRLHLVGPDGRYVRSFAPARRALSRADDNERIGTLWPSRRYGGLWYAPWNRNEIGLYVEYELERVIVRELDWFEPWEGDVVGEPFHEPPRARMWSVAERPDGLLTVLIARADANWAENRDEAVRRAGTERLGSGDFDSHRIFDSVLEILDPETGEIVARGEFDDQLGPMTGDGTVVSIARQDEIGRVRIHVYRVVLPDG